MPIRVLTPQEAARIAAGEVIERPASVAKELIENALDAGARRVEVETRQGGIALLRVSDDGEGIPPEELPTAFERHATSKVRSEEDLWRVATLGFRGEALPSIAAAADVDLVSRPAGSLVAGRISLRDGEVAQQGSAGAPPGTSVTVQRLFGRQPPRLKFLRTPAAEAGQIATVVTHYALAYPEVRFTLRADGRETLVTPGNGDLRDAAAAVYGIELASELLDVEGDAGGSIAVSGLAGSPAAHRGTRGYISLFVNRRWIKSRSLTYAVVEAYQGMLPAGRSPVAILEVRMPADAVDVNVHPTKAEVRFRDERAVFAALQRAVRRTLSARTPVPGLDLEATTPVAAPGTFAPPLEGAPPPLTLQRRTATPGPGRDEQPALVDGEGLPVLRAIGQVGNTYVVAEGPEGVYLVDQHAAHERVLYERTLAQRSNGASEVQPLLQPATVELTAGQRAQLERFAGELGRAGLQVEGFGDGAVLVRAVPPALAGGDVTSALRELLDLLGREDAPRDDPAHRVAASIACHASVRAGQTMTEDEQRELLRLLESCEHPRTCPHGRPTMVHINIDSLARQFRRR